MGFWYETIGGRKVKCIGRRADMVMWIGDLWGAGMWRSMGSRSSMGLGWCCRGEDMGNRYVIFLWV